jgi:hypothetical protein
LLAGCATFHDCNSRNYWSGVASTMKRRRLHVFDVADQIADDF